MDRNHLRGLHQQVVDVALRKESVDRNGVVLDSGITLVPSLSARRAWIEIPVLQIYWLLALVALRKESVDRNTTIISNLPSLRVALRKESVDRN